jgi:hypothetical protein
MGSGIGDACQQYNNRQDKRNGMRLKPFPKRGSLATSRDDVVFVEATAVVYCQYYSIRVVQCNARENRTFLCSY